MLFINVPFGLAVVLLAPRHVTEPDRHRVRLDLRGAFAATIGMASIVYGLLHAATYGWANTTTVTTLGIGSAALVLFLVIEAHSDQPLLPLSLFRDRNRAAAYTNYVLGSAALTSVFFFLTQFLQDVLGLSALATGFAFLPMAVAMFSVTRVVPRILHRTGPRPLTLVGTSTMVIALLWFAQITATTTYASGILVPVTLMGLGAGLTFTPSTPVIFARVPSEHAGAAGGVLQTMQQTGSSLGLATLVTVYGTAIHRTGGTAQVGDVAATVAGMREMFYVAAAFAAAAVAVAMTYPRGAAAVPGSHQGQPIRNGRSSTTSLADRPRRRS